MFATRYDFKMKKRTMQSMRYAEIHVKPQFSEAGGPQFAKRKRF